MVANRTNIAFEIDDIVRRQVPGLDHQRFIPLADVPDRVWKHPSSTPTDAKRGREGPNHYADIDQPLPGAAPTATLLANYPHDPATPHAAAWNGVLRAPRPGPTPTSAGCCRSASRSSTARRSRR